MPGKRAYLVARGAGAPIALLFFAMIDLLFIAVPVIFFAAAWGYTRACERL